MKKDDFLNGEIPGIPDITIYDVLDIDSLPIVVLTDEEKDVCTNGTMISKMKIYRECLEQEDYDICQEVKDTVTKVVKTYIEQHNNKIVTFKPDIRYCIDNRQANDYIEIEITLYYIDDSAKY